jgi:hypothetical protein
MILSRRLTVKPLTDPFARTYAFSGENRLPAVFPMPVHRCSVVLALLQCSHRASSSLTASLWCLWGTVQ